ncbi:uncharacterized protein LOC111692114 [Anoplophora glabripennis]|uniref:uncharacterized protein LOC111692114 n=1 Tax=Anoplophora glabripennis TaxID=217634 RepID=UPI000C7809E1|nr:uncharacterized protein LOC111692114 [Anoplophora glabripennis]
MPNIGGPGQKKMMVMAGVVDSIILYAASVWAGAMKVKLHRDRVIRTQRRMLLRIAHAYRPVSTNAASVIAGVIPIDLKIEERAMIRRLVQTGTNMKEAKVRARGTAHDTWQQRWQNYGRSAWTKRIIPNIRIWADRSKGEVTYQICQALTGHGNFGSYLKRIGKWEQVGCLYCDRVDTVEHTVFSCGRWEALRAEMSETAGQEVTPENWIGLATRTERDWRGIMGAVEKIMTLKEQDLRRREREAE